MKWIGLAFAFLLMSACGKQTAAVDEAATSLLGSVPPDRWKELSERRIFFAHKSVGYNITEGLSDLLRENPGIGVRLIESSSPADLGTPAFAHTTNGVNGDPSGKIASFRKALDTGLGEKVDVALLKFCWADFTSETDIKGLFNEYKRAITDLKASYPRVTFVHLTVPLTVTQSGPKAWIKQILGRPVFGLAENVQRHNFNDLIRHEYGNKEPVFDIAAWESVTPDGRRDEFTADDGRAYPELVGAYAADAGHLNQEGRQWIAAQLLAFLASLPPSYVSE